MPAPTPRPIMVFFSLGRAAKAFGVRAKEVDGAEGEDPGLIAGSIAMFSPYDALPVACRRGPLSTAPGGRLIRPLAWARSLAVILGFTALNAVSVAPVKGNPKRALTLMI